VLPTKARFFANMASVSTMPSELVAYQRETDASQGR
jgi:hypothetical protein